MGATCMYGNISLSDILQQRESHNVMHTASAFKTQMGKDVFEIVL